MPNPKINLFRIITTDYTIYSCLVFPVISLIIMIVTLGNPLLVGILTILSVVALIIAGIRFIRILAIINENQIVDATINRAFFYRGRETLFFDFTYLGEKHYSKQHVIRSKATSRFQPGDSIKALVDWNNPENALIIELFT
jgi:hypothetical protein